MFCIIVEQLNVSTGVNDTPVSSVLYSDFPLAVYSVDSVLLPQAIFGPKPPAAAPAPLPAKKKTKKPISTTAEAPISSADADSTTSDASWRGQNAGWSLVFGIGFGALSYLMWVLSMWRVCHYVEYKCCMTWIYILYMNVRFDVLNMWIQLMVWFICNFSYIICHKKMQNVVIIINNFLFFRNELNVLIRISIIQVIIISSITQKIWNSNNIQNVDFILALVMPTEQRKWKKRFLYLLFN